MIDSIGTWSRGSATRLKRDQVLDAIEMKGGATRDQLAVHFSCSRLTVETHIVNLKREEKIYVGAWREPEQSGQWSPIWMRRTSAQQTSLPRPLPKELRIRAAMREEEDDEPVVQLRGEGIKNEHARMARARSVVLHANDTFDVGVWGGLVRSRVKWATSGAAGSRADEATHA